MNPVSRVGVPPPSPHFVGRADAVKRVRDGLLSPSSNTPVAILLQGGPGIGKTTLTKAVAHDPAVVERFGDNRWFVALETVQSDDSLRDAIVRGLGRDPAAGFAAALDSLKGRPALLILDNLETPWEAERQASEETLSILAQVPGLALLASFRGKERIRGPAWTLTHAVGQLDAPSAIDLFCRVAERPSLAGDPALARFIAALEGVPLAIELVAHRAYGDTALTDLWDEWQRLGAAVAALPGAELDRRTSLAHSIRLSLKSRRMSAPALRLFGLLGRLPAGLSTADRNALMADSFAADETLRLVGLASGSGGRIDLLSPIRQFAAHEHRPSAEDETRWIEHFLDLTRERGEMIGRVGGEGAVARLLPELANIEAAIGAAIEADRLDLAMNVLNEFGRLAFIAVIPSPILWRLADACRQANDALNEASCIFWTGSIAWTRSDLAAAKSAFEKALPLFQQAGARQGEANCIHRLGDVELARCDYAAARSSFETALSLFGKIGDALGEANGIARLGEIAHALSDYAAARSAFEKALPLYQRIGEVLGEANCVLWLGKVALVESEYAAAKIAFDKAGTLYRQFGSVVGEANCILGLGEVAQARNEYAAARLAFDKSLTLCRQVGEMLGEANCIRRIGELAQAQGDHPAARSALEEALALYQRIGEVHGEAACELRLGELAQARGELAAARTAFETALSMYRRIGDGLNEAACRRLLDELEREPEP